MSSDNGKLRSWIQVMALLLGVLTGVIHLDRRITTLEVTLQSVVKVHETLERRLEKLEEKRK